VQVFLTPTHLCIVMEYAAGGELFDHIVKAGRFSEDEARYFFQQLICGVDYCHRSVSRQGRGAAQRARQQLNSNECPAGGRGLERLFACWPVRLPALSGSGGSHPPLRPAQLRPWRPCQMAPRAQP
jgi:hypothetical protein